MPDETRDIEIPPALRERVIAIAIARGISFDDAVRALLAERLALEPEPEAKERPN